MLGRKGFGIEFLEILCIFSQNVINEWICMKDKNQLLKSDSSTIKKIAMG